METNNVTEPKVVSPKLNEADQQVSTKNFYKIENHIQLQMHAFATSVGGKYIPPTEQQITEKLNKTLDTYVPLDYYRIEDDGTITAFGGRMDAYNSSGLHGFILKELPPNIDPSTLYRVYRGCRFSPQETQKAGMARIQGITPQDVVDYWSGEATLESILEKVTDPEKKKLLEMEIGIHIKEHGKTVQSERDRMEDLHTNWGDTSGVDLWVAAAKDPLRTRHRNNEGLELRYGEYLNGNAIDAVLIVDVPDFYYKDFGSEAGILGEIKPEWIRAIIPARGNDEIFIDNKKRAETLLQTPVTNH